MFCYISPSGPVVLDIEEKLKSDRNISPRCECQRSCEGCEANAVQMLGLRAEAVADVPRNPGCGCHKPTALKLQQPAPPHPTIVFVGTPIVVPLPRPCPVCSRVPKAPDHPPPLRGVSPTTLGGSWAKPKDPAKRVTDCGQLPGPGASGKWDLAPGKWGKSLRRPTPPALASGTAFLASWGGVALPTPLKAPLVGPTRD